MNKDRNIHEEREWHLLFVSAIFIICYFRQFCQRYCHHRRLCFFVSLLAE